MIYATICGQASTNWRALFGAMIGGCSKMIEMRNEEVSGENARNVYVDSIHGARGEY